MKDNVLTLADIDNIKINYNLEILSQKKFKRGMMSNVFLIETTNEYKVLKIYPSWFNPGLIDFQARASNHMNLDGIPTPMVFPNKSGSLVTKVRDTNYIIMEYKEGEYISQDKPEHIRLTYLGIAEAQKSLKGFNPEEIFELPYVSQSFTEQLSSLEVLLNQNGENNLDPLIVSYFDRLSQIVNKVQNKLDNLDVPQQLILADCNLNSLLVKDDKITGIVDFDHLQRGLRGFDFIHNFDNLFINKEAENLSLYERVNWDKLGESIRFFSSLDPEIYNELEHFPLMHQKLALHKVISTWEKAYREESTEADISWFEKRKQEYVYILEIPTVLEEEFVKVLKESYEFRD